MAKKSVRELQVRGKRVLIRADLNVPLDDHQKITDDTRIRKFLPTLRHVIENGGRAIVMSHLGRPKGDPAADQKLSLRPVAGRISELLGKPCKFVPYITGPEALAASSGLKDGEVLLLENLRFNPAETVIDQAKKNLDGCLTPAQDEARRSFAQALSAHADLYVNDAFGTCHRKVSDKIGVIKNLLTKVDDILIGGAMTYTFWAAQGRGIGKSLFEPDKLELAKGIIAEAGRKLHLPVDVIAATELKPGVRPQILEGSVPDDLMGLDIGPKTFKEYNQIVGEAGTVVWNGPMGAFETAPFDTGTFALARSLAAATDRGAITVVGGGDSAAAVEKIGLSDRMTHVSTGGGASLKFLEGKKFDPIEVIDEA
jgi:phosphoglycerate kinase